MTPLKLNQTTAALRVCVDRAECGRLSGRVYGQRLTAPIAFADFADLLLRVDAVLDAQAFPQAFERTRVFRPNCTEGIPAAESLEEGLPAVAVAAAQGEVGTFTLHVVTRRNTTWQGFVDWLDDAQPQEYASVLELIKLVGQHIF